MSKLSKQRQEQLQTWRKIEDQKRENQSRYNIKNKRKKATK